MKYRVLPPITAASLTLLIPLLSTPTFAADQLDTISVTATRTERTTKDVPEAISVIDNEQIEKTPMFNIKDAISETPGVLITNPGGSYSARVIIRGAGLKANYGIREIMLIRDGVPITDPDSFTRLDFVDTQDIDQIEITRGPGNLYATGSAGGTIQIISKSVFDMDKNVVKLATGTEGTSNIHARYAMELSDDQALAFSYSNRTANNNWRPHGEFDSNQFTLKHGMYFGENDIWENEASYTEANTSFPGDLDGTQFQNYLDTGEQSGNNTQFDHSGRDSKIFFINSRSEMDMGSYTLKPKLYFNSYSHYHPVTGGISVTPNSQIFGGDLEINKKHQLSGFEAQLAAGITARADLNNGAQRYAYADVTTTDGSSDPFASRILSTTSGNQGKLIEESDNSNTLYGFFAQESLTLTPKTILDIGIRIDAANITQTANEMFTYDWGAGFYKAGTGNTTIDRDFTLLSPKVGVSHQLSDDSNVFASLSQADQIPFANELDDNPNLKKATITNFEVGYKARHNNWQMDSSIYFMTGKDEVIATRESGTTTFNNAGETDKKGIEVSASYGLSPSLVVGTNYAYSDYKYTTFNEVVRTGRTVANIDQSGNTLPFIPENKYSIFAEYEYMQGLSMRLSTDTWGEYWMDNANTEKYKGYDMLTNLFIGYKKGAHRLSLNIENLFDQRYAAEAAKDTSGNTSYEPGTPRKILVSYRFLFDRDTAGKK